MQNVSVKSWTMENEKKQEEIKIRKMIDDFLTSNPYKLNPDTKTVDRVIKGLVMRTIKYGHAYCPCRLIMGDEEKDKKIICPCVYHAEEIERNGECHCNLFVRADYQIKN